MTRRLDLSLVLFGAFAALSLTVWSENWQLSWLNPCVWSVSDAFSNDRLFRSVAYSRLTWLLALTGLWILFYLCVRRYGKGLWGSLVWNLRRIYRPIVAVLLLVCAGLAYVGQPFLDHSTAEMDYGYLFDVDYLETVTCSSRYTDVHPNPATGELYGTAVFQLQNTGAACSIRFLLNPGYRVSSVCVNGEAVPFSLGETSVMNERELTVELPAGPDLELSIDYGGFPQEWNLLSSTQGDMEISSQYMALENDVLSPCPYDVWYQGETLPAVLDITLPGPMTPGSLWNRLLPTSAGTSRWRQNLAYGGRGLPHDSLRGRLCLRGHPPWKLPDSPTISITPASTSPVMEAVDAAHHPTVRWWNTAPNTMARCPFMATIRST